MLLNKHCCSTSVAIILSIAAEKEFDKLYHHSYSQVAVEGIYFNKAKAIYYKPTANIALNNDKLKPLTLRSGRQECPLLPLNLVLAILARAIRQQ